MFPDDATARRDVTITFREPAATVVRGRPTYLPLTLLEKDGITGFDFVDEDGRALPLLTSSEKGMIASGLLIALVREVLRVEGLTPTDAMLAAIRDVAEGTGPGGDDRVTAFWKTVPSREIDRALRGPGWSLLAGVFLALMIRLAHYHLVIVPFRCDGDERRVVRFSYSRPISMDGPAAGALGGDPVSRWTLVKRSIGWEPKEFIFPAYAMGQGGTFHFTVTVPDGAKTTSVELVALEMDDDDQPQRVLLDGGPTGPGATKHVFTRAGRPGLSGYVRVAMRARGSAVIRAACLTAWGIAGLLWVGYFTRGEFFGESADVVRVPASAAKGAASAIAEGTVPTADIEVAASLLLLLPSLAGVYVANASEHRLTSSLAFGVRLLTLLSAGTSFLATGILVLGGDGTVWDGAWMGLAVVAAVIAVVLTRTLSMTWTRDRPLGDFLEERREARNADAD